MQCISRVLIHLELRAKLVSTELYFDIKSQGGQPMPYNLVILAMTTK